MPDLDRVTIQGCDIKRTVSQEPWAILTDPSSNFKQLYLENKNIKMKIKRYKKVIYFIYYVHQIVQSVVLKL